MAVKVPQGKSVRGSGNSFQEIALREITPLNLRCIPASCPAVYEDGNELIIIGKVLTDEQLSKVAGKVGPDEFAVRINKAYFPGGGGGGGG